jgi:hypothetical protein
LGEKILFFFTYFKRIFFKFKRNGNFKGQNSLCSCETMETCSTRVLERNKKATCMVAITVYRLDSNALSFYGSKMILDCPNHFGLVQFVLVGSNLFWLGLDHFGWVQIIKISPQKSNLNLTKMIWTWPKQFGADQNNL